jgi:hypothetical protein
MPRDFHGDAAIEVLISYSHQDETLKNQLIKHLSLLKRQGVIRDWHDRDIEAGFEWRREIEAHLESAEIILLLISPDFLASDFCFNIEMKRAIERHDQGQACVIPVFLRPCDWKGAPFGKLQGLPTDAEPVTSSRWSSVDEAFAVVAGGIRKAVTDLRRRRLRASGVQSTAGLFRWLSGLLATKRPPASAPALDRWIRAVERERTGDKGVRRKVRITPELKQLLLAYDLARGTRRRDGQAQAMPDAYVNACASSLAGSGVVTVIPCAATATDGHVVPLELVLEAHGNQSGDIFVHPLSDDTTATKGEVGAALKRMWEWAKPDPDTVKTSVLWRIRSDDGTQGRLPPLEPDSSWIIAAGYRAFWHLRRGLKVDPDVYVLCAVRKDRSVGPVDNLHESIASIRLRHRSSFPATLVVARSRVEDNETAPDWAATKVVGDIGELVAVRSFAADTAIEFLNHLATEYDKTPWMMSGRSVRLSDIYVPFHVWKDDWRAAGFEGARDPAISDWRPADYDFAVAEREVGPRLEARRIQVRVAWDELFSTRTNAQPLVVVGGPGFGKSSLLAWTARQMAMQSSVAIAERTASIDGTSWPILADLDAWTQQPGSPRESLLKAALERAGVPEEWNKLSCDTLEQIYLRRLREQAHNTFLFLDAVDQVRDSSIATLQQRLDSMVIFGGRLILSSRESALRSRRGMLPFEQMTVVQAAALAPREAADLAAKWLDGPGARELDGHLRSHTTLAVVAGSPLLLTLACLVVLARPKHRLPETAGALYREIMHELGRGAWRQTAVAPLAIADVESFLADLRRMCWHLFCLDPQANRFVRESLIRAFTMSAGGTVSEANRNLALLVALGFLESSDRSEDGEPTYLFRHATFREFLVASYVASELSRDGWELSEIRTRVGTGWTNVRTADLLEQNAFNPAWEPVFLFAAGLLIDPVPLFAMLADAKRDDHFRHRLSLLCQCYGTLGADKECLVTGVMEPVFQYMARRGRRAIEKSPHDWRRWLVDSGNLMILPVGAQRVADSFYQLFGKDGKHHRVHMQSHELLEILTRSAGGVHWRNSADALLKLCVSILGTHHDIGAAAKRIIAIAEERSDQTYVASLLRLVDDAETPMWRSVPVAGALLRTKDETIVDRAFEFLTGVASDGGVESWMRNSASIAIVHGVNGNRETEIGTLLVQILMATETPSQLWRDLADELLREVDDEATKVKVTLVYIVLLLGRTDPDFVKWCARRLTAWHCTKIVAEAVGYLWQIARSSKVDCYPRVKALEGVISFGNAQDRARAIDALKRLAEAAVTDGRQQWLALDALIQAGEDYEPDVRRRAYELAFTADVESNWIIYIAKLAVQQYDARLLDEITPTLLAIRAGERSTRRKGQSDWSERTGAVEILRGTREWAALEQAAFAKLRSLNHDESDWPSVETVVFGAKSSELLKLTGQLLTVGRRNYRPWHRLLHELDARGWRLKVRLDRKIEVIRQGQEEARPDADPHW